jgi:hypothetical protein
MNQKAIPCVHGVTALVTLAAIAFCLFFQISKGGPFRDINPFGEDPYDAVGSFAIQVALLMGILTYARALRLRDDPAQAAKARLIRRGNALVLFAILITLIADAVAEIVRQPSPSFWGNVLLAELVLMFLLALVCAIALIVVFARTQTVAPPPDLTPADAIDDLWTLVRVPVTKAGAFLPRAFVEWVKRFNSDRLFARVPWLNPRMHPWRFACVLGPLVGIGIALAQLQEGLPPSLAIGLLAAGIFISSEFVATLLGYTLFGGYLGLRPSFRKGK